MVYLLKMAIFAAFFWWVWEFDPPKNPGHGNVDVFKCNTHFMFKLHPQFEELYHVVSKNNPKTSWLLPAQKVIETQPQIFNNIQHKPFRASRALPDEFVDSQDATETLEKANERHREVTAMVKAPFADVHCWYCWNKLSKVI